MKIVYVYTALTTLGGADRMIIQKANYLANQLKHDVYIITDSQGDSPFAYELSEKVHHIDLRIDFNKQYRYRFIVRMLFYQYMIIKYKQAIAKLLNDIRPDIVISTLGRDSDFLTRLKDGSKKVGEAHTTRINLRNIQGLLDGNIMQRLAGKLLKQSLERTIRKLDAFVVLNEQEKKNWADVKTPVVIPNSLPFYPITPGILVSKRAISVGRLEWEKGIDRLIDVWQNVHKKHSDWILDIYGEGTLHSLLQKQITNLGADKYIHLKGKTSDIASEYLNSSILILTSRYEGFPMTLLEAMACGVPCVAYDCPFGPQSIITDRYNGFLIEEEDKEKMAERISYLIENEQIRKELGENARKSVLKYSQENIMREWENLFNELISKQ